MPIIQKSNKLESSIPLPFAGVARSQSVTKEVGPVKDPDGNTETQFVQSITTALPFGLLSEGSDYSEGVSKDGKPYVRYDDRTMIFIAGDNGDEQNVFTWNKKELAFPAGPTSRENESVMVDDVTTKQRYMASFFGTREAIYTLNTSGIEQIISRDEFAEKVKKIMTPYDPQWAKSLDGILPKSMLDAETYKGKTFNNHTALYGIVDKKRAELAESNRAQSAAEHKGNGDDTVRRDVNVRDTQARAEPPKKHAHSSTASRSQNAHGTAFITTDGFCAVIRDAAEDMPSAAYCGSQPAPITGTLKHPEVQLTKMSDASVLKALDGIVPKDEREKLALKYDVFLVEHVASGSLGISPAPAKPPSQLIPRRP